MRRRERITAAEFLRLQRIEQYHPEEFFNSSWFGEICGVLDLSPEGVRERAAELRSEYGV